MEDLPAGHDDHGRLGRQRQAALPLRRALHQHQPRLPKLHEALLPYIYSHAHRATKTGVGLARPLALEYPDDPRAATDAAKYEFLSGEDFLVAPVYQDAVERDGIHLPKGTWIDYWSGRTYEGPVTVDDYSAPLDTLPLFVRAGATVPMWPGDIRSYTDRAPGDPIAWDVYPKGTSSFELYEDDGVTREHRTGRYATQRAEVRAPNGGPGDVTVRIGASKGTYTGKPPPGPTPSPSTPATPPET